MLVLLIIIILLCGGFGAFGWNHDDYAPFARGGVGLGTILVIVLIILLISGRL